MTGASCVLPTVLRRARFGLRLLWERLKRADRRCPHCDSQSSERLGRKHVLLEVRRCRQCSLMFRYPKVTSQSSEKYYQGDYDDVEQGDVTTLPDPDDLVELARNGFAGTSWSGETRLRLLAHLAPSPGRLLDFGCSWGYFTHQARGAGYDVLGYEISQRRAHYGTRHLGLEILTHWIELEKLDSASFDVIYTSHVLEHLPRVAGVFEEFYRLLRPGRGLLLGFVPNCGGEAARRLGVHWGPFTSEAHTLSFDQDFFRRSLPQYGFSVECVSEPYLSQGANGPPGERGCRGDELFVMARRS